MLDNLDLTAKYVELNDLIELVSKIYDIAVLKLTPIGVVWPSIAITMLNYFLFDLGDASYFLPNPLMYVRWERTSFDRIKSFICDCHLASMYFCASFNMIALVTVRSDRRFFD